MKDTILSFYDEIINKNATSIANIDGLFSTSQQQSNMIIWDSISGKEGFVQEYNFMMKFMT
jgi:hypothetical protein